MSEQFPGIEKTREKIGTAASKGVIFPIDQEEAIVLRSYTSHVRTNIHERRLWLEARYRTRGLPHDLSFPDIDLTHVIDFMYIMIDIAQGNASASKSYTQDMASAYLDYIVHLHKESDFLLEKQREVLAMND